MIVSMWMKRTVVTVSPDAPIDQAAEILYKNRIRRLPVVREFDGENVVVGLISKTDLLHAYPAGVNPLRGRVFSGMDELPVVQEVMSTPIVHIEPGAPLEQAALLMRSRKIGALPVLQDGELVGIITESDIFDAFISLFEGGENPVRITFDGVESDFEGFVPKVALAAEHAEMRIASLVSFKWKGRLRAVVRAVGPDPDGFLDQLGDGGFRILSVQRD